MSKPPVRQRPKSKKKKKQLTYNYPTKRPRDAKQYVCKSVIQGGPSLEVWLGDEVKPSFM